MKPSSETFPPLPAPNPGCFEPLTPQDEERKAGLREELAPVKKQCSGRLYEFFLRLIDAGHNVYAAHKTDPNNWRNRNYFHIYWHQATYPQFPTQGPPEVWEAAYTAYLTSLLGEKP